MEKSNQEKLLTLKESLNHVGKLLSTAVIIILMLIGAFLMYYVVSAKLISQKAGVVPKISLYTIISGSMEPSIKVFDIILDVRIDDPTKVKVGDVITFISTSSISKGKTVTHRVMDIKKVNDKYEFVTKGDNNPSADSDTAKEDNLIGKTVLKIPKLGYIQWFILSKLGWIILILLPAIGIILYDAMKLFNIIGVNENAKDIKNNSTLLSYSRKAENKKIEEIMEKIKKKRYSVKDKK
ncbi:MAG: signal peptidase I [Bacilli bacterium]|nr:signal peptidase I [Bacilli bacterium]MDD4406907.1 signal peptidase I [Bacilli bacterium]